MRFYELAAKIGIEKKDIKILQDFANESGFEVKNSLASVDDNITAWAEKNAADLAQRVAKAKEKKPTKKRVAAKKKVTKKVATKAPAKTATKAKEAAPAKEKPVKKPATKKPVMLEAPRKKTIDPTPGKLPEADPNKVYKNQKSKSTKVVAKIDNTKKPKKAKPAPKASKREQGKNIKIAPAQRPPQAAAKGEVVLDDTNDAVDHHGHKHKRADFKGSMAKPELPAIFAAMDSEYTRSIRSTGGRKRPGRGKGRGTGVGQGIGGGGRRGKRGRPGPKNVYPESTQTPVISPGMTLRELSIALGIKLNSIMGYFFKSGQMLNVNDVIPEDDMTLVAEEFKVEFEWKQELDLEQQIEQEIAKSGEAAEVTLKRPPVVTFMGHVDHGKTSLLDKIRHTRVAVGEAGGITQHIGAYSIEKDDNKITFLDTPGHEAFTQMRARGANLTDIAVLVIAADDGVMPTTKEAYNHAKIAGVPIVVALNKCDLPNANPDKVKQEISTQLELLPEEWGGQTGVIEVSAHTGDGIDDLLERILLESEVLELEASPDRKAVGYVIESEMTENRGVVATILIHDGTLNRGDIILTSNGYGKVKLMYDWTGKTADSGGPSQAVSVVGLNNVPVVGDKIYVIENLVKARKLSEDREKKARAQALSRRRRSHVTLENLTSYLQANEKRELNVIIKSDVTGSLEVLEKTLLDMQTDEVGINIIHAAVGGISQADIILADASDAIVLGFHVVADHAAKEAAQTHSVQIKVYHIIYRLIEDMKAALEGMLPPEEKEVIRGHIEIREVFRSSRVGNIAGCYVTDGLVNRNCMSRLIRDNIVIYDGKLDSLKRFKDDVKEVKSGFECGLRVVGYDDIKVGDIIEAYEVEEIARKLED